MPALSEQNGVRSANRGVTDKVCAVQEKAEDDGFVTRSLQSMILVCKRPGRL